MKWEYAALLLAILVIPLAKSFDSNIHMYARRGKALILTLTSVSTIFWLWDIAATAAGHWSFNPAYNLGIPFLGLPIEEWLFFPVVGFAAVFTWESVRYFTAHT